MMEKIDHSLDCRSVRGVGELLKKATAGTKACASSSDAGRRASQREGCGVGRPISAAESCPEIGRAHV